MFCESAVQFARIVQQAKEKPGQKIWSGLPVRKNARTGKRGCGFQEEKLLGEKRLEIVRGEFGAPLVQDFVIQCEHLSQNLATFAVLLELTRQKLEREQAGVEINAISP